MTTISGKLLCTNNDDGKHIQFRDGFVTYSANKWILRDFAGNSLMDTKCPPNDCLLIENNDEYLIIAALNTLVIIPCAVNTQGDSPSSIQLNGDGKIHINLAFLQTFKTQWLRTIVMLNESFYLLCDRCRLDCNDLLEFNYRGELISVTFLKMENCGIVKYGDTALIYNHKIERGYQWRYYDAKTYPEELLVESKYVIYGAQSSYPFIEELSTEFKNRGPELSVIINNTSAGIYPHITIVSGRNHCTSTVYFADNIIYIRTITIPFDDSYTIYKFVLPVRGLPVDNTQN